MSYLVIRCQIIAMFVAASVATVAFGPSPVHPEFPGQCWSRSQAKSFTEGSTWVEPGCLKVTCTAHQNQMFLQYASCSRIGVPPGCTTTRDMNLAYPDCCPKPSCPP